MAANILIRDIPPDIRSWIEEQRQTKRLTQREVIIEALSKRVCEEPLFEYGLRKAVAFNPPYASLPFTFIDLFAGIGGLRIGAERAGGRCKFSSEWDPHSQKTYAAWFGEVPAGDINKIDPCSIPSHDLLLAGFPCQPFSIAGVSKKNSLGREHGFKDATQGTLFFQVATIIEIKRPPCVLLENVKNLLSHDKGRTWKVIHSTLEELGYSVFHEVIDAIRYVPQHRERVFIVAFDKRVFGERPPFSFPKASGFEGPKLGSILEENPHPKYTLSDRLWNYLQNYAERHRLKGNGFGFGLVGPEDTTRTLSARYYKDGSEILIRQKGKNPRRLTPREAARLMGFPDELPIVVSDTQAYRQFGNAVVPAVAEAVIAKIVEVMSWYINQNGTCLIKR
jgi:DNA (cytosine-5)-methyltransferase 1